MHKVPGALPPAPVPPPPSGAFRAVPPAPGQPAARPATGSFPAITPGPPGAADIDARIWPRVVEAVRRAEPALVDTVVNAVEARVAQRTAELVAKLDASEARLRALEEQTAKLIALHGQLAALPEQVAQVAQQTKLLELHAAQQQGGAAPPPQDAEALATAVTGSNAMKQLLDARLKTMIERMVTYLEKDVIPRAIKQQG